MKLFRIPLLITWLYPSLKWDFSCKKDNNVYLTFDDGPTPEVSDWVLDYLATENIKATFFLIGKNLVENDAIYKRILSEGHAVGNHTYQHENAYRVENQIYLDSIDRCDALLKSKIFRPPYGKIKNRQVKTLKKRFDIIMWTFLTYDFLQTCPIEKVLKMATKIKAGDIIVFHDSVKAFDNLKILLPQIVRICQQKKLGFAKIP